MEVYDESGKLLENCDFSIGKIVFVTYGGKKYMSKIDANAWAPDVYGWGQVHGQDGQAAQPHTLLCNVRIIFLLGLEPPSFTILSHGC